MLPFEIVFAGYHSPFVQSHLRSVIVTIFILHLS